MPSLCIAQTFRDLMGNASTRNKVEDPLPSAWQPLKDAASAITAGAVAGMVMWTVVLPIDVAKTRIQTAWPGSKHDVGMSRNLVALYREGGYRRLYAGLVPTLIRAAPANAAQWLTWEITMQQWHKWKGNSS